MKGDPFARGPKRFPTCVQTPTYREQGKAEPLNRSPPGEGKMQRIIKGLTHAAGNMDDFFLLHIYPSFTSHMSTLSVITL